MSELTYTVIRLGLLVLLWVFVFSLAAVLRRDIYGTRISRRRGRAARTAAPVPQPAVAGAAPTPPPAAAPLRQGRRRRQPTTLLVTEGQLAGTSVPLGRGGVLVGRSPESTLVLDDEYASGRHLRIYPRGDTWYVEDLGSRNGTTVGGAKITGAVPAEVGTVVRIGRTTLELRD